MSFESHYCRVVIPKESVLCKYWVIVFRANTPRALIRRSPRRNFMSLRLRVFDNIPVTLFPSPNVSSIFLFSPIASARIIISPSSPTFFGQNWFFCCSLIAHYNRSSISIHLSVCDYVYSIIVKKKKTRYIFENDSVMKLNTASFNFLIFFLIEMYNSTMNSRTFGTDIEG